MDFQVVILAGGSSPKLSPIISDELPKPLLPVANRPILSYILELLESCDLKDLIVVVEGTDAAVRVGGWISGTYADRLHVEVASVPEDAGTGDALRYVAHHLTANDVLIISGDIVTDVPPGAVAATHRRHGAAVTALLCNTPISGSSEPGSTAGKDKAKKTVRHNIIGLDSTKQFLVHVAAGADVDKDIRVQKSILRAVGQMEIRADLMDAHMYAFKRSILHEVLNQNEKFHSIKHDVLPYLVRTQLCSKITTNGAHNGEEVSNGAPFLYDNLTWLSQHREIAPSSFLENKACANGSTQDQRTHKCCAYIANKSKYCARLNSIQAFSDINRDVVGEVSYLSGYSFSTQKNIVHPSSEVGSKTTIGPQCMVSECSKLGDKCSVKRSIIGRHCRIGSNVKIINSVVMNHVTVEDGCIIQNSIVCSNVQLQERAVLKDCQVGAGYIVTSGSEHKSESLAKK